MASTPAGAAPAPSADSAPLKTSVGSLELVAAQYEDEVRRARLFQASKDLADVFRNNRYRSLTLSERTAFRSCAFAFGGGVLLSALIPIGIHLRARWSGAGLFRKFFLPFGLVFPLFMGGTCVSAARYCLSCISVVPSNTLTGKAYADFERERQGYEEFRAKVDQKFVAASAAAANGRVS